MIFSVSGLPRSGTCWAAAFFSMNQSCIGLHEFATCNVEWKNGIKKYDAIYEYVADCNTYSMITDFPYQKRIWIDRDPNECLKSSEALFGEIDRHQWNKFVDRSMEYKKKCFIVPFREMFTDFWMNEMWFHVFKRNTLDLFKSKMLAEMNIQRNKAKELFTYDNCKHIL
jgi:hypothetical protein